MTIWEVLGDVAAAFLVLLIVLMIIAAVVTAVIVVFALVMAIKESKTKKRMDALPDRMMQQAAAGLKEREERHESM